MAAALGLTKGRTGLEEEGMEVDLVSPQLKGHGTELVAALVVAHLLASTPQATETAV